jgi:hypothetical protein
MNPKSGKTTLWARVRSLTFLLLLGALLLVSCSEFITQASYTDQFNQPPASITTEENPLPTPCMVGVEVNPGLSTSISELAHYSDAVIIGEIVDAEYMVISTGDDNKCDGILNSGFEIVKVYQVSVEEYITGEGETTIWISQNLLIPLFAVSKEAVTDEFIENVIKTGRSYQQLQIDKKYLMFLHQNLPYPEEFPDKVRYVGGGFPWYFDVSDPEAVRVQGEYVEHLIEIFPPQPLSEIIEQINQPYVKPTRKPQPTETTPAYPVPTSAYPAPSIPAPSIGSTPYP